MSYVFSGKIQSAMFVNPPQNSTIELLYGEGTELTAFHLDVNYSSDEFLAFVDEWPLEKVEQTARDNARNINAERDKFATNAIISDFDPRVFKLLIEYFGSSVDFDPSSITDLPPNYKKLDYQADAVNEGFTLLQKHRGFFYQM